MAFIRKTISIFMILFGLIGILGSLTVFYYIDNYKFSEKLEDPTQLTESIDEIFTATSVTMKDASLSAKNAGKTTLTIQEILKTTTSSLSTASTGLSETSSLFNLLNISYTSQISQKFSAVSNEIFSTSSSLNKVSSQFGTLSENLETTAINLENNAEDMEKLGDDLSQVSVKLNTLSFKFNAIANQDYTPYLYKAQIFGKVLFIYLAILHLMFFFTGIFLFSKN